MHVTLDGCRRALCVPIVGIVVGTLSTGSAADLAAASDHGSTVAAHTFQALNILEIDVPERGRQLRVWLALPQETPEQRVRQLEIEAPAGHHLVEDSAGNRLAYFELEGTGSPIRIVTRFVLERREVRRDLSPRGRPQAEEDVARYLEPSEHVVINDRVRALAARIVDDEEDPMLAARRIYDWILENADYWVKDPALKKPSKVGSTTYCLNTGTGSCSDFHSLFTSLARASGIPSRIIYGSFFKRQLDGLDVDQSYHCWVEFFVSGLGWMAADVALADLFAGSFPLTDENRELVNLSTPSGYEGPDPKRVAYYFGNLEPRRVTWSRGRALSLSPEQAGGPVNALPKAWVELDGEPLPEGTGWRRKLTYRELSSQAQPAP